MKRSIPFTLAVVFILLLAGAQVLQAEETAPAQPAALLPEPSHVFDTIPEGIDVFHDFPIRNTGTAVLKIEKVKTG